MRWNSPKISSWLLCCAAAAALASEQRVSPDAALVADFEKRVAEYLKLRKEVAAGLPRLKPAESATAIKAHETALAERIRRARSQAKQGDLFTPAIAAEFRRLIAIAMKGQRETRIRESLKSGEPVNLALHVNQKYPSGAPLQSTPPTLLTNLPKLPDSLRYDIVGGSLVLHDVAANLVVDIMNNALP